MPLGDRHPPDSGVPSYGETAAAEAILSAEGRGGGVRDKRRWVTGEPQRGGAATKEEFLNAEAADSKPGEKSVAPWGQPQRNSTRFFGKRIAKEL